MNSVRGANEKIAIIKGKYNLLGFYGALEGGRSTALCQPQKPT